MRNSQVQKAIKGKSKGFSPVNSHSQDQGLNSHTINNWKGYGGLDIQYNELIIFTKLVPSSRYGVWNRFMLTLASLSNFVYILNMTILFICKFECA